MHACSKHMWTSNPGYVMRNGGTMASVGKTDMVYDQEELAYMREQGFLEKTHNRRRDDFGKVGAVGHPACTWA